MATHSSVLAWRIQGMGEPGGLPSVGSHRVGHDWSDLAAAAAAAAATANWQVIGIWKWLYQCVAIPFSRVSSWPRDRTQLSCVAGRFFTLWATREALTSQGLGEDHKEWHVKTLKNISYIHVWVLCTFAMATSVLWSGWAASTYRHHLTSYRICCCCCCCCC